MSEKQSINENIYTLVTDASGEERSCANIPDEACEDVPKGFVHNALSGVFSKLAEQLASPGLILPWLLSAAGASSFFSGALVPIKDAGSLLPQLAVSGKIRTLQKRKIPWVLAAIVQGLALLCMAWAVSKTEGNLLGWLVVITLAIFSLASGVASVAYKDVLGKTIPKGKRGQLLAVRSTAGGVLTTIGGYILYKYIDETDDMSIYLTLIASSALLWFVSAGLFYAIPEVKGATEGGRTPLKEFKQGWLLLKKNKNLQRFVIARALLMAIPFSQPFIILYGKEHVGSSIDNLGIMVVAAGIAGIISSPFWGRFADISSRKLMIFVGIMGFLILLLAVFFPALPNQWQYKYTYALIILLQVMAHGGARMSRKTYLVDMAPSHERPLYVALSNTLIGLATLLFVVLGLIADVFSVDVMLWTLAITSLLSALVSLRLKEV